MFSNLSAEMARRHMTIKDLAKITGIKYESLKNKISGATEFKRSEMFLIKKKAFPSHTIDYLFGEEGE